MSHVSQGHPRTQEAGAPPSRLTRFQEVQTMLVRITEEWRWRQAGVCQAGLTHDLPSAVFCGPNISGPQECPSVSSGELFQYTPNTCPLSSKRLTYWKSSHSYLPSNQFENFSSLLTHSSLRKSFLFGNLLLQLSTQISINRDYHFIQMVIHYCHLF